MTDRSADNAALTEIDAEVAKVRSLIGAAAGHLDSGKAVDLGALEARVGALCAALRAAPAGHARRYAGTLHEIVEGLDGLTAALDRQFDAFAAGLRPVSPDRAAGAYRKADG